MHIYLGNFKIKLHVALLSPLCTSLFGKAPAFQDLFLSGKIFLISYYRHQKLNFQSKLENIDLRFSIQFGSEVRNMKPEIISKRSCWPLNQLH